jgi:DNA-binding LacI/PurR family transcriptional regulator
MNTVNTDMLAGAQLAANHTKKFGYKNIVILAEKSRAAADHDLINDIEGALSIIPGMNNPVIIELDSSSANGEVNIENLDPFLRPPFRADLIITLHAQLVYPLLSQLAKKKIRVPQDIALISMEEGQGFDILSTPVTCLRKPLPGMAIKAANMLWTEIKNSGKGKFKRQINITPELVVRNSCGNN